MGQFAEPDFERPTAVYPSPHRELCSTLFRNAQDGILVLDEAGTVVDINDAASEFLGHAGDEIVGRPLRETIAVRLVAPEPDLLTRLGRESRSLVELSLLKPDGELVVLELSASRIADDSGTYYLGILKDVSARQRVEEELRRRNKELFVINAIGAVISRSLDPEEVLTNGLDEVLSLLDIEAGFIVLRAQDADELKLVVHRGLSAEFVEEYTRRPLRVGESITGQVFVTGRPVHSRDASHDPRVTREVVRRNRIKSSLNIPLVAKDRILGVLMVASFGIRSFSTRDIEVLTTIANQIGVALENSRLYRNVEERSREVWSLLNLSNELNRKLDTDGLLRLVAESARALVPCETAAAAFFGSKTADCFIVPGPIRRHLSMSTMTAVPSSESPIFNQRPRLRPDSSCCESLAIPIVDTRGKVFGLVELYRSKVSNGDNGGGRFTGEDADLITALAAQASTAFEKARLFQEMEKEMEFVADIVDNLASGLIVTDLEGVIRRTNRRAADMLEVEERELRGTSLKEWIPLRGSLTEPLPHTFEIEMRSAAGRAFPAKVIASVRVDDTGSPLGMVLVLEDLEEVRRSESKEKERERLATIGEVASGIAHEIRNPLFGISSVAQILKMEGSTREEHRPLLDAMMGEVERLDGLVEDLLFYGRPSTLHLSSVDLHELWESILLFAANEVKKRELEVTAKISSTGAVVTADPERLRQVFLNLLKNAIEASSPRGRIRIDVVPSKMDQREGFSTAVSDEGCGIDLEVQPRVFDLFFSKKRGGSGVGLSICRKIVEDHGGRIEVESRPGTGSTFVVWLPVEPVEPGESIRPIREGGRS